MSLGLKLRNIFFISLLLIKYCFSQIAVQNFINRSNYEGNWNLSYQIPDFISDYLRERFNLLVLSPYLLEKEWNYYQNQFSSLSEFLVSKEIQFLIKGTIKEFSIQRLTAGEPKFAQYETYSNDVKIEIEVLDLLKNQVVLFETIRQKSSELGAGVTIFGRESEIKREFYRLDQIEFGSLDFMTTLIGKNLLKLCEKLSIKLEPIFINIQQETEKTNIEVHSTSGTKFKKMIFWGEILFVDEATREVFVNLGKKENIEEGMALSVYVDKDTIYDATTGELLGIVDKKIGEIEIIEVRGERFSLGIIREEREKISKGNKVKVYQLISR